MLHSILQEVLSVRDDAIENALTHELVMKRVQAIREVAAKQKLKRDGMTINATLNAVLHKISVKDTVFCYVVDGVVYPNQAVAGYSTSTEDLIGKNYTAAQWDSFGQITIWKQSGELYSTVKVQGE